MRRLLKKLIVFACVFLLVLWGAISVGLNSQIKDRLEAELSKQIGRPVTIGHLRAGWDPLHPAVAAMNVKMGEDKKHPEAEAAKVELGVFLKNVRPGMDFIHEPLYAAVAGVRVGNKPYGDYEAQVAMPKDMHFTISDLKGEYKGAKLTGEASEDLKYHWNADLAAENLDYSVLSEDLQGGKARVTLRLHGSSEVPRDIIAHTSGRATLVGGEGKVAGRALNLWAGSLLTAFLPGKGAAHVNCAVADFNVVNGVAKSRTVIIDTNDATITGSGSIDFVRQRVYMRFVPRTKGLGAVVSLATPMVVSGTFDSLSTHPDATGMAEKMGGLLLSAVTPAAALLPLLHSGDGNSCQKFLEKGAK